MTFYTGAFQFNGDHIYLIKRAHEPDGPEYDDDAEELYDEFDGDPDGVVTNEGKQINVFMTEKYFFRPECMDCIRENYNLKDAAAMGLKIRWQPWGSGETEDQPENGEETP